MSDPSKLGAELAQAALSSILRHNHRYRAGVSDMKWEDRTSRMFHFKWVNRAARRYIAWVGKRMDERGIRPQDVATADGVDTLRLLCDLWVEHADEPFPITKHSWEIVVDAANTTFDRIIVLNNDESLEAAWSISVLAKQLGHPELAYLVAGYLCSRGFIIHDAIRMKPPISAAQISELTSSNDRWKFDIRTWPKEQLDDDRTDQWWRTAELAKKLAEAEE